MTVPRYSYLIERDQDIWLIYFMDDGDLVRGESYLDYEGALVAGELWLQEMNKEAPGIDEPGAEVKCGPFLTGLIIVMMNGISSSRNSKPKTRSEVSSLNHDCPRGRAY